MPFNRIKNTVKEYFTFTRSERNGISILLIILLVLLAGLYYTHFIIFQSLSLHVYLNFSAAFTFGAPPSLPTPAPALAAAADTNTPAAAAAPIAFSGFALPSAAASTTYVHLVRTCEMFVRADNVFCLF